MRKRSMGPLRGASIDPDPDPDPAAAAAAACKGVPEAVSAPGRTAAFTLGFHTPARWSYVATALIVSRAARLLREGWAAWKPSTS